MKRVKALRNQADKLEQDLRQLEQKYKKQEEDLHKEYQKQLKETEDNFKKMRLEDQKTLKQAYENLKQDLLQIQSREMEAVKKRAEAMHTKREKLLKQLEELRHELQIEQQELIKKKKQDEDAGKAVLSELTDRVQLCFQELEQKPHEFFFPGELDLIKSRGTQVQTAVDHNMYQAAAAMMLSAETESELLKIRTDREFLEWNEMFSDYKLLVNGLAARLKLYSDSPFETPAGMCFLSEQELNFWSMGLYCQVAAMIVQMEAAVRRMEQMGLGVYLKTQQAPKGYEFRKVLKELQEMELSLQAVMDAIGAERYFSDERSVTAKKAREIMEENGYLCLGSGFLESEGQENPMDSYELSFCLNPYDRIFARIVPVREHGIAVGSQCLLWMEMNTIPEETLIQNILDVNCDRMKAVAKIPVATVGSDCEKSVFMEKQLKKQADLIQYEKYRRKNRRKGELTI